MAGFFIYITAECGTRVSSWQSGKVRAFPSRRPAEGGRYKGKPQGARQLVDTCRVRVRMISVQRDLEGVWLASD